MSGHAQQPTQILASGKALEARGLVTIPVLVRGEWHPLVATPSTWRGLAEQLAAVGITAGDIPPAAPTPAPRPRRAVRSADRERFLALYREHRELRITIVDIARREGIKYWKLNSAFRRFRDEEVLAATRLPIEKPRGGVL